jgi:methionyl-tRNA synthetase
LSKYITTAIDYPNALPHIGTAFEKIGADVCARYWRFKGEQVYFLGGNDENTIKVVKKAKELGIPTQEYVDSLAVEFKKTWAALGISYDDFIQTTEERHKIGVQHFISAVNDAGYIYKKLYRGHYCEGCEEYKISGYCENHPGAVVEKEEENYFFKLSAFKKWILDLIYPTPFITAFLDIQPESRYNEIKNFVDNDLQDISISRRNQGWGIPIPWDESQVIYVWFDALLNYLTGIGFGTDWDKFDKWWTADAVSASIVHFVGKDITRFHCALFPAMIKAYNDSPSARKKICYPQEVFAHGFIYQRANNTLHKVSKSGTYISPLDLIEKYGSEAYRYYFLSKCSFHDDGEYSLEHFEQVYNSDLANELGNVVCRVVAMINQYFEGKLPADSIETPVQWLDASTLQKYTQFIENYHYKDCLELIWNILRSCNQYIETSKPWSLAKTDKHECFVVLRNLVAGLRATSLLLIPFLPGTADKVYNTFHFYSTDGTLATVVANNLAGFERGVTVNKEFLVDGKYPPLFPRR